MLCVFAEIVANRNNRKGTIVFICSRLGTASNRILIPVEQSLKKEINKNRGGDLYLYRVVQSVLAFYTVGLTCFLRVST